MAVVVVLVEGRSDQAALRVLARRHDLTSGGEIRARNGATNVRRHLHTAVMDAVTRRVLGLTDEPDAPFVLRALAVEGAEVLRVDGLPTRGSHTSSCPVHAWATPWCEPGVRLRASCTPFSQR